MKDWNGNKASAKSMLGVNYKTNTSAADREQNDYYATDPIAVRKLAEKYDLPLVIWEYACGAGHLSQELTKLGHRVYSSDLIDRGYGASGIDFLKAKEMPIGCNCILTNPPYKYANEFILHALELLQPRGICAMLLNVCQLTGKTRYEKIYRHNPPRYVFIFSSRVQCAKNGEFNANKGFGAINYAWFVWEKGYKGNPEIIWL